MVSGAIPQIEPRMDLCQPQRLFRSGTHSLLNHPETGPTGLVGPVVKFSSLYSFAAPRGGQ